MPDFDTQSRALKALTLWWEDMGIEADTLPSAKPKLRPGTPAKPTPARDPLQKPQKPAIATPQAAQAAGFGASDGDPEEARKAVANVKTLDELNAAIKAFNGGFQFVERFRFFHGLARLFRITIQPAEPGRLCSLRCGDGGLLLALQRIGFRQGR